MTAEDRTRTSLHRRLEEQVGAEEADYLMERLSPVTWQDLATKDDLGALDGKLVALDSKVSALDGKLGDVRAEFYDAMNQQTWRLVTFAGLWSTVLVSVTTAVAALVP